MFSFLLDSEANSYYICWESACPYLVTSLHVIETINKPSALPLVPLRTDYLLNMSALLLRLNRVLNMTLRTDKRMYQAGEVRFE